MSISVRGSAAPNEPRSRRSFERLSAHNNAVTTQRGTVSGPNPVQTGLSQARSVSFTVYDNGTVSAFITTGHRTGYRVMLLADPTRIVVDIAY